MVAGGGTGGGGLLGTGGALVGTGFAGTGGGAFLGTEGACEGRKISDGGGSSVGSGCDEHESLHKYSPFSLLYSTHQLHPLTPQ